MRLARCKDQAKAPLDQFFEELTLQEDYAGRDGAKAMLGLISRLRASDCPHRVYGLTSHDRLCLLAEDSYASSWFVIVSALDSNNYRVEYRMPDRLSPWPEAYVTGESHSEDGALRMVLIAMERSEGWLGREHHKE